MISHPTLRTLSAALALHTIAATTVTAQWPSGGTVYERTVRERRMNGHQAPAFTPWGKDLLVFHLDSLQPTASGVIAFFATGDARSINRHRAVMTMQPDGRGSRISTAFDPPPRRPPLFLDGDTNRLERIRVLFNGVSRLPAGGAWDLIPSVHPKRFAIGERWQDSVDWNDGHAGTTASLRGVRTSRLVRDSSSNGHHYWLVRDTLRGEWSEQITEYERTLASDVRTTRQAKAIMTGQYWVDPETRLLVSRDDTLEAKGTATLHYPDGRNFSSPTSFQQTVHVEAFDSAAYAALLVARRAAAPRFSMFNFPQGAVAESLAVGSIKVRDSLVRKLSQSRDIDERLAVQRQLFDWRQPDMRAWRDTLRSVFFRDGDTTEAIRQLLDPATTQFDPARLRLLLPFARDPGLAFAYGIPIGEFYENLEQRLAEYPPAVFPDSTRWPCTRAACATLAGLRLGEREPRLRRVGMATSFALEPKPWVDSIRADPHFLQMSHLANGVGATWPASSHPGLPPIGASWQRWAEWMNGAPLPADTGARAPAPGTPPALRFGESHRNALAVQELITGRRFTEEWQEQENQATVGAAHLVFETLLATRDAWHPSPDSVSHWLQTGSKLDRARGQAGAGVLMRGATQPVDSALLTTLIDRMLAHTIDGEEPWPTLTNDRGPPPIGNLLDNATRPGRGLAAQSPQTIYVKTPVVTAALRAKWGDRVTWITDPTWSLGKDRYPAAVITIHGLAANGAFASVGADVFSARQDNKGINAGEGGNTYLLLRTSDGWRIISVSTWVV